MNRTNLDFRKIFSVVLIISALIVAFFAGSIKVNLTDAAIEIKATLSSKKVVPYTDIKQLSIVEVESFGQRTFGVETSKIKTGKFKNDLWGEYSLYAYSSLKVVIEVELNDGSIVCFNQKSLEETQALYNAISNILAKEV